MPKPNGWEEHGELLQLLMRAQQGLPRTQVVVLITVGDDGRPCVGGVCFVRSCDFPRGMA